MATKQTTVGYKLRVPPNDLEAEQALLGSVMLNPKGLAEVLDFLTPEDFFAGRNQKIFAAMAKLFEKGEPVDLISVSAWLKENKQLESAGGSAYVAELSARVPSASNLRYYADLVHRKSALRSLIEASEKISDLGYQEDREVEEVLDEAQKVIFNLGAFTNKKVINLKDALGEAWERFDRLSKSDGAMRGVPTGFHDLDNKLAGLQKSDLIILAARPSVGKTSLALDIARHAACREETPTCIFSLEMSSQQLTDRLLAAESFVDSWKLRTGAIRADEEFARLRDALDTLAQAPIFIDDEPSNNIMRMKSEARKLKAEHGLGLIVVDYLQLMVPRRETDSQVQMVTEISRSLKALARELEVPVLALSQLSRAVEQRGGKPRLSDLRDSGSIEQDADVVMFIHREKNEDTNEKHDIAEILIEKHRNGPTGKIDLVFDGARTSFSNMEKGDFGAFS
ncbi:MAG TPA: replicative DNA helicase [Candidatus Paceibacterota bacterium]|jgi:replicative DNA helicase|nr:replicative DNA helicase [Candidatus Paceibacterota bacterium]HOH11468.1 replicative DNA helicase [Candidatus Paceibacterota bacterium]HOY11097.1 replicative DNA helicase [Candidatus Paceibacterota bacterium]HPB60443.1 replicative DNA helicase [Candidatus Paceibacterota bacterium]HPI24410.1 replicative DNA helicase [Candidatus Paceibacterota bacterium]